MFMHGGFLHIAGNMLFLWVFGNNIEDRLGRLKFLLFYLLAGLIAVYTQAVIDSSSTAPTIGASGAIAGVLGAYALLYPKARVLTLIFIIFFVTLVEIPALILLAIWFILQFIPALDRWRSRRAEDRESPISRTSAASSSDWPSRRSSLRSLDVATEKRCRDYRSTEPNWILIFATPCCCWG